jgi:flagellar biogenesis protein FliO
MREKREGVGGVVGWVLRALKNGRAKSEARELALVETLSLGGRRQLMLVSCAGQKFLVGCGGDNVQTIVAVSAKDEVAV